MKTVTAAEANRQFSSVLRAATQGEEFTVLSRGRPVATIGPVNQKPDARRVAKAALLARLRVRAQAPTEARNWSRDDLYED